MVSKMLVKCQMQSVVGEWPIHYHT